MGAERLHLKKEWLRIKEELLSGIYEPKPVRVIEIPKPSGGKRMLGIPTVLDRMIQQALLQVIGPIFEPTFSDASYGFRPKRSAQQAVTQAREHIAAGHRYVVGLGTRRSLRLRRDAAPRATRVRSEVELPTLVGV